VDLISSINFSIPEISGHIGEKCGPVAQPPVVDRFKNTSDARAAGDRERGVGSERARSEQTEMAEEQPRKRRDGRRKRESERARGLTKLAEREKDARKDH
jgi:hypothetical protein